MPDYGNPGGGEDAYSDAYDSPAKPSNTPESAESEDSGETAVLPKSICPGMKPGDEMVLKIVRVHDDQYEVAYAPEPKGESEESPEPATMPGDRSEMASMMED